MRFLSPIYAVTSIESLSQSLQSSPTTMDELRLSPLKENGTNTGQVGTSLPELTILQQILLVEPGFIPDVSAVRELAIDQPEEAEAALSLTYAAPLRMTRPIAENLLSHYYDLWLRGENWMKTDRQPRVMAFMLLRILRYMLRRRQLTLVDSS